MPQLTYIIDTREQKPWLLSPCVRRRLFVGDYSVVGYESRLVVERKSLADLTHTLTRGWQRFRIELAFLSKMTKHPGLSGTVAVVIESSVVDLQAHRYPSKVSPVAILHRIAMVERDYGIPFVWAEDRPKAVRWAQEFLLRGVRLLGKPQ